MKHSWQLVLRTTNIRGKVAGIKIMFKEEEARVEKIARQYKALMMGSMNGLPLVLVRCMDLPSRGFEITENDRKEMLVVRSKNRVESGQVPGNGLVPKLPEKDSAGHIRRTRRRYF